MSLFFNYFLGSYPQFSYNYLVFSNFLASFQQLNFRAFVFNKIVASFVVFLVFSQSSFPRSPASSRLSNFRSTIPALRGVIRLDSTTHLGYHSPAAMSSEKCIVKMHRMRKMHRTSLRRTAWVGCHTDYPGREKRGMGARLSGATGSRRGPTSLAVGETYGDGNGGLAVFNPTPKGLNSTPSGSLTLSACLLVRRFHLRLMTFMPFGHVWRPDLRLI